MSTKTQSTAQPEEIEQFFAPTFAYHDAIKFEYPKTKKEMSLSCNDLTYHLKALKLPNKYSTPSTAWWQSYFIVCEALNIDKFTIDSNNKKSVKIVTYYNKFTTSRVEYEGTVYAEEMKIKVMAEVITNAFKITDFSSSAGDDSKSDSKSEGKTQGLNIKVTRSNQSDDTKMYNYDMIIRISDEILLFIKRNAQKGVLGSTSKNPGIEFYNGIQKTFGFQNPKEELKGKKLDEAFLIPVIEYGREVIKTVKGQLFDPNTKFFDGANFTYSIEDKKKSPKQIHPSVDELREIFTSGSTSTVVLSWPNIKVTNKMISVKPNYDSIKVITNPKTDYNEFSEEMNEQELEEMTHILSDKTKADMENLTFKPRPVDNDSSSNTEEELNRLAQLLSETRQ
jgi:hypothetical protein